MNRLGSQKQRVALLFSLHAALSGAVGALAVVLPNVVEWLLVHHGQRLQLRDNLRGAEAKVAHLLIRLLGALLLTTSAIVWQLRTAEAGVRRCVVQAFALFFGLSTLVLMRAQMTETTGGAMSGWNWVNIAACLALTAQYAYFACVDRIAVFDFGKSMS